MSRLVLILFCTFFSLYSFSQDVFDIGVRQIEIFFNEPNWDDSLDIYYANNNGERLETYVIPGSRGSGEITVNGAAARKVDIGDVLILIAYASMSFEEAKNFKPCIIFPNEENNLLK